ncbi:MAG TPA: DUF4861 domain-containing protein [bacterium]|nr:DUF4861 domain-containing protein [bacterium]HQJ65945.1 DUF4861 domain-containing protein [bacterium]
MKKFATLLLLSAALLSACTAQVSDKIKKEYPAALTLHLRNPLPTARMDEIVAIPLEQVKVRAADFNPRAILLIAMGREVPAQHDDADGDGTPDRILANLDLRGRQKVKLTIRYARSGVKERIYTQRTQAELSAKFGGDWKDHKYLGGTFHNIDAITVPKEHTDHSGYFRYEGPGWESDKVGYRFYLDWRNATDLYGKKTTALVLQNVGLDGFESYHHMADWGMDILKVGDALGIGTIAWWDGQKANRIAVTDSVRCRIATVGPLLSRIRTDYFGWKAGPNTLNLHSDLSICAGSRMTRHLVMIHGGIDNLCTGLVKLPDTERIPPPAAGEYTWLATWGVQSLNNDHLGMAVLFRRSDLMEETEDGLNHVAVLKPEGGRLEYYFLGAWALEPGGITTREAFATMLAETAARLNNPVIIE